MRFKKICMAVLTLSLGALLSGCEAQPEVSPTQPPPVRPQPPQTTEQLSQAARLGLTQEELPLPSAIAPIEAFQPALPALSATDQAAIDAAFKLNDASYCEKMSTDDYKSQCRTVLEDKGIYDEALLKAEASLCQNLSTKDLQEACKIQVEVIMKEARAKQQFSDEVQKSNDIIVSKDYTRCSKELKDPAVIDSCELTIIMNLAIEKNDANLCENVSRPEAREQCKRDFEQFSTPPTGQT